jgi:transcriptional regulator with XRE-family HTH domain
MATQIAPYPNHLRACIKRAGYLNKEVASEIGVSESTLYDWAAGLRPIPHKVRPTLARLLGCSVEALVPSSGIPASHLVQYALHGDPQQQTIGGMGIPAVPRGMKWGPTPIMADETTTNWLDGQDGCFSFGKVKTTGMVLDGDGTEVYLPAHIRTYYDAVPAVFLEEVMQAKEQIQREQEEKQRNGEPYQWNGEKYHLSKVVISREPRNT